MRKIKKIVCCVILFTSAITILYIIYNIYTLIKSGFGTSFPWWSAFCFAGIYFGPILIIEGIIYGLLYLVEKKIDKY